ncbi:alpha/beta fold hydrolase [Humitalea sp. 24SJ18S-53]|uniref:alpha/beta fold hydrolase n=1 Tax=Humitalea sp. 24SJ18S-53 TaxID=3422307 RepID=UPI003D67FC6E
MIDERRIDHAGARIFARAEGPEGAPWVVFSNSLFTDHRLWDSQVAWLAETHRVLRYDHRGHGASTASFGAYDFTLLTGDLDAVITAFGAQKPALVGLSIGAATVLRHAATRPGVASRVLASDGQWGTAPGGRDAWLARVAQAEAGGLEPLVEPTIDRWFTPPTLAAAPPVLDHARAMMRATSVEGYCGCGRALADFDHRADFPGLALPVTFLAGAADVGLIPALKAMQAATPGSRYVEVPAAGHLPNLENPAGFAAELRVFLGV